MSKWINFNAQLPSENDATAGFVRACMSDETERITLWDWIPPLHLQAKEIWVANGFVCWQRIDDGEMPEVEESI